MTRHPTKQYLQIFEDNWLFEIPMQTGFDGTSQDYNNLVPVIDELINNGACIKSFQNELFGIENSHGDNFYWLGKDRDIITQVTPFDRGSAILVTAKNPESRSSYHASDLYQRIIQETNVPLIFSGDQVSTGGEKIWKWMRNNNVPVFAYKPNDPLHYQRLKTSSDFDTLLGKDESFKDYRFILNPDNLSLTECWSAFEMRRIYQTAFRMI